MDKPMAIEACWLAAEEHAQPGVEAVVRFENASDRDVRLIHYDVAVFDAQNACVGHVRDNWLAVRIAPGDAMLVDLHCELASALVSADDMRLRVVVHASLYARTLHRLGSIAIPDGSESRAVLEGRIEAGALGEMTTTLVELSPSDEDGESIVDVRCAVQNASDQRIERITLRTELIDDDGIVVAIEQSDLPVRPSAFAVIDQRLVAADPALHGAKLRCALAVFEHVRDCMANGAVAL